MLGKTLGHYEIVDLLGRGGMGEVYRARDTRLGRVVALKILPRELSGDPERVARFQREARTLASLQHPNIASVYGYDEVDGVRFLAMELVEGEDLSARIARGPLPEDEAVEVLRRIAAALDAAHAMSIVHRDLKPANIKLTLEGDVKVLDFGLARAYAGDSEIEGDPTLSPTITAAMTQAGTILGTAAYMAPEQARGRRVDHRVDIWAMGVILYEMLVGRRLFEGDTVTDVLAGVITIQPDLGRVPESTSAPVRRILQRCLQKDPARRLRAAADAVLELDLPFDHAPPGIAETSGRLSRTWPWLVSAALTIAIIVLLLPAGGQDLAPIHSKHYDLAFGPQFRTSSTYEPYISPDGDWVAVAISDTLGRPLTYLRSIRTGELRILDGSADENNFFWSPDSRYLGFQTRGRLHKLHVETLSSQLIGASGQFQGRGASWSKNNQILFAPNANSSLLLIDAEGGNAIEVTQLDTTLVDASHRWPKFLPDGRRFLFTLWSNLKEERASVGGIYLGSLDGGTPHRLLRDVSEALFARSGQILFHRDGRLMAVDFDWEGGTIESEPRVISDVVAFTPTNGKLGASISDAGEIVLSPLRQDLELQLQWFEEGSRAAGLVGQKLEGIFDFGVSSAGDRYFVELLGDVGSVQIWVGEVARGTFARLSRFENDCTGAAFSPNGREIAYVVYLGDHAELYRHDVSGARDAVKLLDVPERLALQRVEHWVDDTSLLVSGLPDESGVAGIYRIEIVTGEMSEVLQDQFAQYAPRISPDGRWIVYVSEESGRPEIYVRSWPDLERKWQISRDGGEAPHWTGDGSHIFFSATNSREFWRVAFLGDSAEPEIGLPEFVAKPPRGARGFAVAERNLRVLYAMGAAVGSLPPAQVLIGWQ